MGIDWHRQHPYICTSVRYCLAKPSVVAIERDSSQVSAVGSEARKWLVAPGEHTSCKADEDGVIADFDVTERMLRHFISKANRRRVFRPRVVVAVPSGLRGWRAVIDATLSAGAKDARLIEEPWLPRSIQFTSSEPTGSDCGHRRRNYRGCHYFQRIVSIVLFE